jgi:hypothetical protein
MSDHEANSYRWMTNHGDGSFGTIRPEDDFLHLAGNPPGASVTETYYFGFHIADQAVHGYIYIWVHPNLRVVTAGAMISRGFQHAFLAADYCDIRAYLALDEHHDPGTGVMRFPSGLTLTPVEAMGHWRLQLDAPALQTSFDLEARAAQPPIIRSDLKHLDQNMHVRGELVLRGRRHRVDCHQIRDRSWANPRLEDPMPVPPYDWLCLTRGAEFSMNLSLFDDLRVLGDAGGVLRVPPKLLQDGWVALGAGPSAEQRRIVEVAKKTTRTPDTLMPLRHEVTAVDDRGDRYDLVGESIGGCNWNGWPNMIWRQNLMRWTCNGAPCWGESQEVQWHETVRLLSRAPATAVAPAGNAQTD